MVDNQRKEYSFYIGKNRAPTEKEKKSFPKETYPITMSLYIGNEEDLTQVKERLAQMPKDKVKYRQYQGGYCKTGIDIFAACVDSIKHILFDEGSPIKEAALIERTNTNKQVFPYQILDKARQIISEPEIGLNTPKGKGRR